MKSVTPYRILVGLVLVAMLAIAALQPNDAPSRLQTLEYYSGPAGRGVSGGQLNLHFQLQENGRYQYLARCGREAVDRGEVDPFVVEGLSSALSELGLSEHPGWPKVDCNTEIAHVEIATDATVVSNTWTAFSPTGMKATQLMERVPRFKKALEEARKLRARSR